MKMQVAGVYISWPFCAQKCTFCNFASGVQPEGLERAYAAALIKEIRSHVWLWTPETVYLGGGTPSAMSETALAHLMDSIPGRPWHEATIEAAPGSITADRIAAWKSAGINRISLGVQSFVKSELARTGRRHDASIVERDIAELRNGGLPNINIDLIAGLPGQTEASWRESLRWIETLRPPHVSVYMLEVDEDSRLGSEILLAGKRYGAPDVPSDEQIAGFYEVAACELFRLAINRYEISNFAVRGAESIHNLKYWRREPYIGFGADAHSFDGERRWQNVEIVREYVDRSVRSETVRFESTDASSTEEKFFVGLRLSEGVETDDADWQLFGASFERFIALGLMEREGARLRLTPRGLMISNEIFQEFLTA